jgi:hypothetical protein
MMMLFPGAVGIVAEDAVGVGYHVWLRDVCSATVRRPWDSRRSTPDLLTLSQWTKTTQKKNRSRNWSTKPGALPVSRKPFNMGLVAVVTISSPSAGLHVSYDLVNHTFLAMILPPKELLGCDCGFYFSIHRKQLDAGDGIVFEVVCTKRDWRAC